MRFRVARADDAHRVLISGTNSGCYSGVGRWYNQATQELNLGTNCVKVII